MRIHVHKTTFCLQYTLFSQCAVFMLQTAVHTKQAMSICSTAVIFNRGSAEPQGSARICQGFHSSSVKNINNLACKITSDQAIDWSILRTAHRICLNMLNNIIYTVTLNKSLPAALSSAFQGFVSHSHRFSASWLRWWKHQSPDSRHPENSTLPTSLNSRIMPWGSVSDFDTYVGFRCSKKIEKHCPTVCAKALNTLNIAVKRNYLVIWHPWRLLKEKGTSTTFVHGNNF